MSDRNKPSLTPEEVRDRILAILEEHKGQSIECLDVTGMTAIADYMIVVSGTSSRHVKALSTHVIETMREHGVRCQGHEGEQDAEWILLDFGDTLVHIMQHATREFYDLESLWQTGFRQAEQLRGHDRADT